MAREMTVAVDAAAAAQPDGPSRSEMIRRIVADWLRNDLAAALPLTDDEWARLDEWRAEQPDRPDRGAAARRLVLSALEAEMVSRLPAGWLKD